MAQRIRDTPKIYEVNPIDQRRRLLMVAMQPDTGPVMLQRLCALSVIALPVGDT